MSGSRCFLSNVLPELILLSFCSKTRQGHNQKSQCYDGGVELPEHMEQPCLLLPTYFPDYTAEKNVQNLWGAMRSQQRHKGGCRSKCKTGQVTKCRTQLRSLVFHLRFYQSALLKSANMRWSRGHRPSVLEPERPSATHSGESGASSGHWCDFMAKGINF